MLCSWDVSSEHAALGAGMGRQCHGTGWLPILRSISLREQEQRGTLSRAGTRDGRHGLGVSSMSLGCVQGTRL